MLASFSRIREAIITPAFYRDPLAMFLGQSHASKFISTLDRRNARITKLTRISINPASGYLPTGLYVLDTRIASSNALLQVRIRGRTTGDTNTVFFEIILEIMQFLVNACQL